MYKMPTLLKTMVNRSASDLFITAGTQPSMKINGEISHVDGEELDSNASRDLCYSIMNEKNRRDFEADKECNFAIHPKSIGRFRVNVFVQQGNVGMVLRLIKSHIPSMEDLRLPPIVEKICMDKRGLVVFVGGTGTGKSTSQASLIDFRNKNSYGHIVTVEDPVEYLHEHKNCIVTQREVGVDTDSFENALVNAMRQAPDVIQIGEIRTKETMEAAITFSETGHLCFATLHANNSYQALDRIFNFFPSDHRDQLAQDLSMNLNAMVSQRLLPHTDGKGRVPAVEVLLNSPLVADQIKELRIDELRETIEKSNERGMQSFDQSLFELYEKDLISYEDAIANAESENNLRLRIKLEGKEAKNVKLGKSIAHVGFDDT